MPQGGATFFLGLGQNLIFFLKLQRAYAYGAYAHDFDHLGEG